MHRTLGVLFAIAALMQPILGSHAQADGDWSRFRGPNGSGVSSQGQLPVDFGPDKGLVWATETPFGRSSPALAADRLFLTAVEDHELVTLAFDRASGKLLWRRGVERDHQADLYHGTDSASASPATDGENVYVFFHEAGLLSYDADGKERWRVELGPFRNFYGIAASPVVSGDTLFMVVDQVRGSFLLALDTSSGKERWRQARAARIESYATPVLYPSDESPTELLVLGSSWIDAYDLHTGEVRWSMSGLGVGPVASPALAGDLLFVSAPDHASEPPPPFAEIVGKHDANGDGVLSRDELEGSWMQAHFGFVDIDGNGSLSSTDWDNLNHEMTSDNWGVYGVRLGRGERPEILWNVRQSVPYIPSPLVYDGVVYAVKDTILTSLDPKTGEVLKRGRLAKEKTGVNASPIGGDGKVYLATTNGKVAVLSAGPQWEILALNDMGDEIHATPAVADGRLFVRTNSRLYCFAAPTSGSSGSAN